MQLQDALKTYSDRVDVTAVTQFNNFGKWLDKYYKPLKPNTTSKNHVFKVDGKSRGECCTILKTQTYSKAVTEQQSLLLGKCNTELRKQRIRKLLSNIEDKLVSLSPPGLKDLKAVELWQKWGPCVPVEFRDDTCSKPSNKVINRVREQQKIERDK